MMSVILHTALKELKLLWRDPTGLAVLFLMPAVLVLVICLVQDNVMKATGQSSARVLLLDLDGGQLGELLEDSLGSSSDMQLQRAPATMTDAQATQAVADGKYQLCIVIPAGTSKGLTASYLAPQGEGGGAGMDQSAGGKFPEVEALLIKVRFDPTAQGAFRSSVMASLREAATRIEAAKKWEVYSAKVAESLRERMTEMMGMPPGEDELPLVQWDEARLFSVEQEQTTLRLPTSTQQNVPAWALFGMFFTVVPIAGTLVRERLESTLARMSITPASFGAILTGKIVAFACVCQLQFALMLAIGLYVLPLAGAPRLEMGDQYLPIALVCLAASVAAAGYGLLVGALARTHEQASMFGSVSVVIAAVVGGVMVPTYVMPAPMRALSDISPLNWALEAFIELFVRDGSLENVLPGVAALLLFAAFTIAIARQRLVQQRSENC